VTENELPEFQLIFRRAYLAAQARWKTDDYDDRAALYFRRLRVASVKDVATAAGTWFDSNNKFPSIAEWLGALPTDEAHRAGAPPGTRIMSKSEIAEWDAAMRRLCVGDPCTCFACVEAAIDQQPTRFVPVDDAKVWHGGRRELVLPGEWIHGRVLGRWYAAREAFFRSITRASPGLQRAARNLLRFEDRINQIFARPPREVGEEG